MYCKELRSIGNAAGRSDALACKTATKDARQVGVKRPGSQEMFVDQVMCLKQTVAHETSRMVPQSSVPVLT